MAVLQFLVMLFLFILAIFLIVLVLIQRGKGGGLAGAFGGLGGQSAFGTKAGDLFTRITIGVAAVWILLCVISVKLFSTGEGRVRLPGTTQEETVPGTGNGAGSTSGEGTSDAGGAQTAEEPAPVAPGDKGAASK